MNYRATAAAAIVLLCTFATALATHATTPSQIAAIATHIAGLPVANPSCLVTAVEDYATAANPAPHDFAATGASVSLAVDSNAGDAGYNQQQVYVGSTCLTCVQSVGGPAPTAYKQTVRLSPQGDWVLFTSEMASHPTWGTGANLTYEQNNGYFENLWLTNLTGSAWFEVTNYQWDGINGHVNGTLSPRMSPDETRLVWAEHAPDGAGAALQDWQVGFVTVTNVSGVLNFSPESYLNAPYPASFYEIHGYDASGTRLLVSGAPGVSAAGTPTSATFPYGSLGSDLYVVTGSPGAAVWTDITRAIDPSGTLWEEHAFWSPHGTEVAVEAQAPNPAVIGPPLNDQNQSYNTWRGDVTLDLWVIGADGSAPVRVSGLVIPALGAPNPWYDPANHHSASQVTWNTTGDQIKVLVGTNPPGNGTSQSGHVWLVQFNGTCG